MYQNTLYSTGITVYYGYGGSDRYGWRASVDFQDLGHCDRGTVQGNISTKDADILSFSIDTIKYGAEKLGIRFQSFISDKPWIYYLQDGISKDYPPPENWRQCLKREADRLGWRTYKEKEEESS